MIGQTNKTLDFSAINHIIWDWNGTLLNDIDLVVEITNQMLEFRGWPGIDCHRYRSLFGFPVAEFYVKMGFSFDTEPYDHLVHEFTSKYESRCLGCQLHDGVKEILQRLKQKNISQSILSAAKQSVLKETVDSFGITGYFAAIAGLDDKRADSKLESGKELISRMSLSPNSVLMVGDTLHDYEVASALGANCLIIPNGHNTPERFIGCPAYIVPSLADLGKLL